jgi:hypothetical protein
LSVKEKDVFKGWYFSPHWGAYDNGKGTQAGVLAVCDWVVDKLERYPVITAVLVLLFIFVTVLGQSAGKFLWFDELVTLNTASLPHWRDVWNF